MSANEAVKRLAELVSVLSAEFRALHSENKKLKQQITEFNEQNENNQNRDRGHLKLVEQPGSSLQDREQVIARLQEMLDELEEIV